MKETLKELGLKTLLWDEVSYYVNRDGKLLGVVLSHVDDFTVAGEEEFVKRIVKGVSDEFSVSKIEEDEFRFTRLDIKAKNGKIEVSMEDYANSVEPIEEIRKAEKQKS